MRARTAAIGFICVLLGACSAGTPAAPAATMLSAGVWTGDGCLSVTGDGCELIVGCGHGRFPMPPIGADGTFSVEGTYRIEAGPVSTDLAPPATFSGVVKGQTMTLVVTPRDSSGRPAPNSLQFVLQFNNSSGRCVAACV
jgi:hypothetical protein